MYLKNFIKHPQVIPESLISALILKRSNSPEDMPAQALGTMHNNINTHWSDT